MQNSKWQELYNKCVNCQKCPLYQTRTNVVFGSGNKNADIVFIGEAPGKNEDEQALPFVGRSGKLLDTYLQTIGLLRQDIYIANIIKCRPPNNRDPKPSEESACIDYLNFQLSLINPKIIVCLGRIAAFKMIKPDFKITTEHGKWFKKDNFHICAVYHPSAILRDPRKKDDMAKDFLSIKEKLSSI